MNDFIDQYIVLPNSEIIIWTDSDYKTNPNVELAILNFAKVTNFKLNPFCLFWQSSNFF